MLVFVIVAGPSVTGQTYAERLGWKPGQVVVILHVDDAGMSHSSNRGVLKATEGGVATSCAVMMPCSWVPEIAHYVRAHPQTDSGLHLTLTSKWKLYRWGPLAGKPQVPGPVDGEGRLWPSVAEVATQASPDEVEREPRAQIERAVVALRNVPSTKRLLKPPSFSVAQVAARRTHGSVGRGTRGECPGQRTN